MRSREIKHRSNNIFAVFAILVTIALGMLLFFISRYKYFDNSFLLEETNPGYYHVLLQAKTQDKEINTSDYRLVSLEKDGFAEVSPSDIKLYLRHIKSECPIIDYISFVYEDDTAVEISLSDAFKAVYGIAGDNGVISEVIKTVDITQPLIDQIDGITDLHHRYGPNNVVIYEFRTDQDGNAITDLNGFAGFERKLDLSGKEIDYVTLGEDGKAKSGPRGYAEIQREYGESQITVSYYDDNGNAVNCIDGYAKEVKGYDEEGNVITQEFYDHNNNLVISPYGYAEVHRVFDNNNKITKEEYFDPNGNPLKTPAGYVAISQEWSDGILISRTYLDEQGTPMIRNDGYSKAQWILDSENNTWNIQLENTDGTVAEIENINLAKDLEYGTDGWSKWMVPDLGVENSCFVIGSANLGIKNEGDIYSCQLEIEFTNVKGVDGTPFAFVAQGAQDGRWYTGNVWNKNLVYIDEPPEDGIYHYTSTVTITGEMVGVSNFELGFRCDNWKSGLFRVRYIMIEKGESVGTWGAGI